MAKIMTDISLRLRANSAELNKGLKAGSNSVKRFNKDVKGMSGKSGRAFKNMQKNAGGAFSSIASSMSSMGPAGMAASGGFNAMTMAARGLNAALGPIGIIIGAIALAVKALSSYFKNTTAGADVLTKIMGKLKGILGVLQDVLTNLGEALVKAFQDPKQAISDLWAAIKNNFIERWMGMKKFFVSSFKLLQDGFRLVGASLKGIFNKQAREDAKKWAEEVKKDMLDVADAQVQMLSGRNIKEWGQTFNKVRDDVNKGIARGNKLSELEIKRDKLLTHYASDRAKYSRDYQKYYAIAADTSKSLQERQAAAVKAEQALADLRDTEMEKAKLDYDIQVQKNALAKSGYADLKAQDELKAEMIRKEDEYYGKTKRLVSTRNAINKGLEKEVALLKKEIAIVTKEGEKLQEIRLNPVVDTSQLADMGNYMERNAELSKQAAQNLEASKTGWEIFSGGLMQSIAQGTIFMNLFSGMANVLSDAFSGTKSVLEGFKKFFSTFIKAMITKLIAATLAALALAVVLQFIPGMGALSSLKGATLGKTFGSILTSFAGLKGMAAGGIVGGPTLAVVGEYPGAKTNPEVVAPLSSLKSILGDTGGGTVEFRIDGTELVGVLNNQGIKTNSF